MIEVLRCTVNNKPVEVGIDPRESLADVLRERLGLTSVKKGCEVGECGACTVLVDGTAIDSCIYLGVWAQGKSILTVEGLQEPDGGLSPIQRAFVEEAAVQCGFCTPGIIMSAVEIVGSGKQYTSHSGPEECNRHNNDYDRNNQLPMLAAPVGCTLNRVYHLFNKVLFTFRL